jgi:hypothetical protein
VSSIRKTPCARSRVNRQLGTVYYSGLPGQLEVDEHLLHSLVPHALTTYYIKPKFTFLKSNLV